MKNRERATVYCRIYIIYFIYIYIISMLYIRMRFPVCDKETFVKVAADAQVRPEKRQWSRKHCCWSADLWCPCYFRVPLTCCTGVKVRLSAAAPAALLPRHVGGAGNVWTDLLRLSEGATGGSSGEGEHGHGPRTAHFLRVERRCQGQDVSGGGGGGGGGHRGEELRRRRQRRSSFSLRHLRHRVRDLLRWVWALRGARVRARLVLRHRAEAHLLPLRHRRPLPRTHRDPAGHQGHLDPGECVDRVHDVVLLHIVWTLPYWKFEGRGRSRKFVNRGQ